MVDISLGLLSKSIPVKMRSAGEARVVIFLTFVTNIFLFIIIILYLKYITT